MTYAEDFQQIKPSNPRIQLKHGAVYHTSAACHYTTKFKNLSENEAVSHYQNYAMWSPYKIPEHVVDGCEFLTHL